MVEHQMRSLLSFSSTVTYSPNTTTNKKSALGGLEKAQALRSLSDALSVILTNRSSTTGRHAGFTAIWIDGRRRLVGVCNRHAIIKKIIHTVTVGIACGSKYFRNLRQRIRACAGHVDDDFFR